MSISQNELARRAKISKSSLSEALDDGSVQTTVMPQKALGWPMPPLALSPDTLELIALYNQMDARDQGAMVERARANVEKTKKTPR